MADHKELARERFERIDMKVRLLASRLVMIGDALLYRTEHVSVSNMPADQLEQIADHDDMMIVDAGALAATADLEQMIVDWHQAKKDL
jgi:hypothetical protein